jgi:hypothetical protein
LGAVGIGRVNLIRVARSARRRAVYATTHPGAWAGPEVVEVQAAAATAKVMSPATPVVGQRSDDTGNRL